MFSIARLIMLNTSKTADAEQTAQQTAASHRDLIDQKESARSAQSQFEADTARITKVTAQHDEPAYALGTWDGGDWANDAFFF